jgi:hypothetical protein
MPAMILSTEPKYPSRRACVVKLRSDATSRGFVGRPENLVTGSHCEFKSPRRQLRLISGGILSPRAGSTAITVSTSAMVASFTTPGAATDCAADRWKKFLSNTSRAAAASGSDMIGHASFVAKSWHARAGGWANATTAS